MAEQRMNEDDDELDLSPIESFERHLKCSCCGNRLKDPKTLSCLHSMCSECLVNNRQTQIRLRRSQPELPPASADSEIDEPQPRGLENLEPHSSASGGTIPEAVTTTYQTLSEGGSAINPNNQVYHFVVSDSVRLDTPVDPNMYNLDWLSCPVDGCDGSMPDMRDIDDLDLIEINAPLTNIEATLTLKENLQHGHLVCETCHEKPAIGVCYNSQCNNHPLCGDCLTVHLREKRGEKHSIAYPEPPDALEGDEDENADSRKRNKRAWELLRETNLLCNLHGNSADERYHKRNKYCVDHDQVVCSECTVLATHHAGCRVFEVKDAYQESCNETKGKLENVTELLQYFQCALETTEAVQKALKTKLDEVEDSINERYERLMLELQNQRDDALRQAGRIFDLKKNELTQHSARLKRVSANLSRTVDHVTDFVRTAVPSEFLMRKTKCDRRLDELMDRYQNYHCSPIEDACIYFTENEDFDMTGAIGKVFSTPSTSKFAVQPLTLAPTAFEPIYLRIFACDVMQTKISSSKWLPDLQATIRNIERDLSIEAYVECDKENGKYLIMFYPSLGGPHELCVYEEMNKPYYKIYTGKVKLIVNVREQRLVPFTMFR